MLLNRPQDYAPLSVVDNVACGPAIGGTRMASDVSVEECARLARAMTLKSAAAGLPHGGAKSVIFGDPSMPLQEKERCIRAFAQSIRELVEYIPGPDMGTNETCMGWIRDEIGRSAGLPREVGGIPLDEIGATGFGLAISGEVAQEFCKVELQGARIAVQGFGAVGIHAARALIERGAILVAASDSRSTIANRDGLDCLALEKHKRATGRLADFSGGRTMDRDAIIGIDCDVWIPAARPDVLRADNVGQLKAKLVLQGANIPVTLEAEKTLHEKGILSVPDYLANAGGVICASVEYHGGSQKQAFEQIEEKIRRNVHEVLARARAHDRLPRAAADEIAEQRVRKAMALRRWKTEV